MQKSIICYYDPQFVIYTLPLSLIITAGVIIMIITGESCFSISSAQLREILHTAKMDSEKNTLSPNQVRLWKSFDHPNFGCPSDGLSGYQIIPTYTFVVVAVQLCRNFTLLYGVWISYEVFYVEAHWFVHAYASCAPTTPVITNFAYMKVRANSGQLWSHYVENSNFIRKPLLNGSISLQYPSEYEGHQSDGQTHFHTTGPYLPGKLPCTLLTTILVVTLLWFVYLLPYA